MRKVIAVPVVIGALGAVSVYFKEYMKRIGVKVRLEDTKESTVPVLVRRRKGETWDPW